MKALADAQWFKDACVVCQEFARPLAGAVLDAGIVGDESDCDASCDMAGCDADCDAGSDISGDIGSSTSSLTL